MATGEPINNNYLHADFNNHMNSHSNLSYENLMPDQTQTINTTTTTGSTFNHTSLGNSISAAPTGELIWQNNNFTVSNDTFTISRDSILSTGDITIGNSTHPNCDFCENGYGFLRIGEKSICGICVNKESLDSEHLLGLIGDLLLLVTSDREDSDLLEEARDVLRKVDIREHMKRAVA